MKNNIDENKPLQDNDTLYNITSFDIYGNNFFAYRVELYPPKSVYWSPSIHMGMDYKLSTIYKNVTNGEAIFAIVLILS